MVAEEIAGWQEHYRNVPFGDPYCQYLLAEIWAMLQVVFGAKKASWRDVMTWAPPEAPEAIEARKSSERKKAVDWFAQAGLKFIPPSGKEA